MKSELSPAKTQLVFKLEKEPNGFNQVFAPNCEVKIKNTEGLLYLNYEKRAERVVGLYKNLRQEGEAILADVMLNESLSPIEFRFDYAIEGAISKRNDKGEVESVEVLGVGVLMDNKS